MIRLLLALTSLLLLASVGLNIYLIKERVEQIEQVPPIESISLPAVDSTKEAPAYSDAYLSAQTYFEQKTFDRAINVFEQLIKSADSADAKTLKAQWLAQAYRWLEANDLANLKVFEQLYLKRFPDDIDFLLLEADRLTQTESLLDGAIAYYQLQSKPLSEKEYQQVSDRINDITLPNLQKLMQSSAWDVVEQFAEPLLQFEPDNEQILLILAEAYAQQQETSLMEHTFSRVTYRDDLDKEFRRIRNLIRYNKPAQPTENQQPPASGGAVALLQTGSHYIVKAFLDNRSALDLLIDTGASTTAITRQRFTRLYKKHRPELIGRFPINTANGQVNAPLFRFSSLTIGDFQVNNFAVIVLPERSNLETDGLLGMNFLRHYDFRIDQRLNELHLQQR